MPRGGHRRRYDPKHAQKIKEGGKIAEQIRKQTNLRHKEEEIPMAEEELLKDLEEINNN